MYLRGRSHTNSKGTFQNFIRDIPETTAFQIAFLESLEEVKNSLELDNI